MSRVVEIRTGSRLHFGLFDTRATAGRQGGIGMMVDRPGWELRGRLAEADAIIADPETTMRIQGNLQKLERLRSTQHGIRIEVPSTIPAHRGLGSGTQLSLTVMGLLDELGMLSQGNATATLMRGERSLVGTLGYALGGFVIDPGERPVIGNAEPRVVKMPEQWRFVIVEPTDAGQFSGEVETEAFARLAPMTGETREQLARLVERQIVPGLEQESFVDVAAGIGEFNRLVGEQFAPSQGGIYAHPVLRELADVLRKTNWPHLAQSSWGAAGVVFCPTEESAGRLITFLEDQFEAESVRLIKAKPLNRGAEISTF